jgi:hypothetical protein
MKTLVSIIALFSICSCASLSNRQEQELRSWELEGVAIREKDPSTGAWLGILPGVGSFYTGQIGLGIVDLLTWPISVCWDPAVGYQGAKVRNWEASSAYVDKLEKNRKIALDKLEDLRERNLITEIDYRQMRRQITNAGLKEFEKDYDVESKVRQPASTGVKTSNAEKLQSKLNQSDEE